MPDRLKVVDASALAAILFAEPRAEEAAALLDDCHLAAPTLLRYEIGSVCLKKLATYPHKQRPLLEALALYPRMNLREFEVPIPESVALARRERLTAYDAAYLWLAQELDVELVTFDDTLRRASH